MTGVEATSAFGGDPQPVEVFHRGTWYAGELLGWRHEAAGRCAARVRCRIGNLRHSAWVGLADLRLPRSGTAEDDAPARLHGDFRPPVPPAPPAGRHRAPDRAPVHEPHGAVDETQPHVLLPGRRTRPVPVTLPPPHYPRPSEQAAPRGVPAG